MTRLLLTGVWLFSLLACLFGVEMYIDHLEKGVAILVADDRVPIMEPITTFYGLYLAGILGFWYGKPFTSRASSKLENTRALLALLTAVVVNAVMVYGVWHVHFSGTGLVHDDVSSAVKIAGYLSFLVAPANLYYFGIKPSAA